MHEGVADLLDGDLRARAAEAALDAVLGADGPGEDGEDGGGDDGCRRASAREAAGCDEAGAVRHHDGEDGEDGDGADVDHDLGEADELRAELEVERGEAGEADGEREDAVDRRCAGPWRRRFRRR